MSKYIIEEKRLKELLSAEHNLRAMEMSGVYKWYYYGNHLSDYLGGMNQLFTSEEIKEYDADYLISKLVESDIKSFDKLKKTDDVIIANHKEKTADITIPFAIKLYQEAEKQLQEIKEIIKKIIADYLYEELISEVYADMQSKTLNFMINNKIYYIDCCITSKYSTDGNCTHDFEVEDIGIDNRIKIQQIFTTKEKDSD